MNYFKQIFFEMRHQRMMTWVSISGTALAIFLVMALFMSEQVKTVEVAPMSERSRILFGQGIDVYSENGNSGSTTNITPQMAERLYGNLDGIERSGRLQPSTGTVLLNERGKSSKEFISLTVDGDFWKVFDFTFLHGKPFSQAESEAGSGKVVITASTARTVFGEEDVVGRQLEVNHSPYTVGGVVKDVNPMLTRVYASIYLPYKPKDTYDGVWGDISVALLMKPGVKAEHIKKQVEERYVRLKSDMAADGQEPKYHQQPYTAEESTLWFGSNNDPDLASHRRTNWIIYTILILLPAINLSSMTRSRLRHRVAEIGVRRAFGARRSEIVRQLLGENLIITIVGGIIGLLFSILAMLLVSHLFFANGGIFADQLDVIMARPSFSMLFKWSTFGFALAICFILNIISATVPAWRASRMEPAIAISRAH